MNQVTIPMPPYRPRTLRLSDDEKKALDALEVGQSRNYQDKETARCAYTRLQEQGKRPIRKTMRDGTILVWRGQ